MDRPIEKKKWTLKRILTIAAIAAFLMFLVYIFFIRDKQSRLYVNKDQLSVATVMEDKFQEFIPNDGVVFPKNTVYIDAVTGGIVEAVYVEDGAILKKGDPILKLMNANMELSTMEQETRMLDAINNLQNTKIQLEQGKYIREKEIATLTYQLQQAEIDYNRKKQLFESQVIAKKDWEDAEREYFGLKRQLELSKELQKLDSIFAYSQIKQINQSILRMGANLELLRRTIENLNIKAPANGKLSSFSAEIGEIKQAGEHLGQIDMMDGYKLKARIDERYISRVFVGQEAEFDFNRQTYKLNISKIYTDVVNGTFEVELLFEGESPKSIKRGQTVQLRIIFSSASDAIIVKRGGFFQETGGNWIYVVDPSGDFAVKRDINIGRQNTRYYEVKEGLDPGEQVIVSSYKSFGGKDKLIFRD
ncbi:MAG: HlyD family efflux transporter periplasmic adaptor subunit [Bacteroidales bacterium]|jgi:HlyD family secretion protein|nr:HlyD family efflux transporter periplasmic adaptor subunit [Bacteroidales bacterium]